MLENAADDRKSPMHTPVLASTGSNGAPRQRVMVLRAADRACGLLRFHTDSRAPKTDDFAASPAASVLAYDAQQKVQLRLTGTAHVEQDSVLAQKAWDASELYSRRCYMIESPPGTLIDRPYSGLPEHVVGKKPSPAETEKVRGNFAIIRFDVTQIDWLYLHHEGNIAAQFDRCVDGGWNGNWHIP